jgi:hypothetical protein
LSDEAMKIIDRVEHMNSIFLPQVEEYTITVKEIKADYKSSTEMVFVREKKVKRGKNT